MQRRDSNPRRVAPDRYLWRTLNRLSYSAEAYLDKYPIEFVNLIKGTTSLSIDSHRTFDLINLIKSITSLAIDSCRHFQSRQHSSHQYSFEKRHQGQSQLELSNAFHILPPSSDAKRLPVYQYLSHCGEKVADEMDKSFTCDEILSASSYKSSKTSSSINDGNETFFGSSEYRTLSNMLLSRVV